MKLKTIFGLIALLVTIVTVQAIEPVHVNFAAEKISQLMCDNTYVAMAAPIIVSANITPEIIKDLQLKFGKIKLITVVVEPGIYDIDELTRSDKANLRRLGIDVDTISNTELDIKDRLKPLEQLSDFRDDNEKSKIAVSLSKYSGKVVEEAEQYQFIVKRPDRGLIKMLLPLAEKGKVDEFAEKAVKNLVVGGDMDALEDGIVYMGVIPQLRRMISPARSFLSKA